MEFTQERAFLHKLLGDSVVKVKDTGLTAPRETLDVEDISHLLAPEERADGGHQREEAPFLVALDQPFFLVFGVGNVGRSVSGKVSGLFCRKQAGAERSLHNVVYDFFFS